MRLSSFDVDGVIKCAMVCLSLCDESYGEDMVMLNTVVDQSSAICAEVGVNDVRIQFWRQSERYHLKCFDYDENINI